MKCNNNHTNCFYVGEIIHACPTLEGDFSYSVFWCTQSFLGKLWFPHTYYMPVLEEIAMFLAATKQLLEHIFLSVCLSVRPSVRHTIWHCSCPRIILQISGVIAIDRRDVHAKGQGQSARVKVAEVMTPFNRFRTVTPVWIHICWSNEN